MKTIIAGSRNINSISLVRDAMRLAKEREGIEPTLIVSGCAPGIDNQGEHWADEQGLPIFRMPAEWKQYGKAAGPIRNIEMANYADALVAIWDGYSKGTKHMIATATKLGLKIFVFFLNKPNPVWQKKFSSLEEQMNDWNG